MPNVALLTDPTNNVKWNARKYEISPDENKKNKSNANVASLINSTNSMAIRTSTFGKLKPSNLVHKFIKNDALNTDNLKAAQINRYNQAKSSNEGYKLLTSPTE